MSNKVRRIETFLKVVFLLAFFANAVFAILDYIHQVWLEASSFTVEAILFLISFLIAKDLLDALYFSTNTAENLVYKEQKDLKSPTTISNQNSAEDIARIYLEQKSAPRTNGSASEDVFNYLVDLAKNGSQTKAETEIKEAKQLGLLTKSQEAQLKNLVTTKNEDRQ